VTELLHASLQFPTVVFTIGLGVALVYWLFVVLGALDIDLFHAGDVGGHDIDLGGHDVDVGGHDVGAHGSGDAGGDAGHDAETAAVGMWLALGLGAVPLTISISVITLLGWCASVLIESHVDINPWLQLVVFPAVLLGSVLCASVVLRPIAPVFKLREGKSNKDYVGHLCTITTGRVDDGFGQATVEDGGTVLVIPVRCDQAGALARGHRALIIDFDRGRAAYVVEPSADMLAEPSTSTDTADQA
jgi:hypothetical protein